MELFRVEGEADADAGGILVPRRARIAHWTKKQNYQETAIIREPNQLRGPKSESKKLRLESGAPQTQKRGREFD
jgi:hypothetical protein